MTIYIIDLESIPSRYTCEWKTHLPNMIKKHGLDVVVIDGPDDLPDNTTPGMFLNFSATNIYKSVQVEKFSRLFSEGKIKDGDYFLFTDAWHPGVINLRYMSELLGIKIKIGGCWHAGSYDRWDGLGRLIGDAPWVRYAEKSFYHSFDHNYFATQFHINMFVKNLLGHENYFSAMEKKKIIRTGWPMEYMPDLFKEYDTSEKEDIIIFPHRLAPEKQVEIFRDLAESLPEYKFVVCQDNKLTKQEYHKLLAKSKIMWSANLQETLGISPFEGALLGVIPLLPDRLSYSEMYDVRYLYPDEWTSSMENYYKHKTDIITLIKNTMGQYDIISKDTKGRLAPHLLKEYFTAYSLINQLLRK